MNSTQFAPSQLTQGSTSQNALRKDLLRVALREVLVRNGIPSGWMSAEMLRTTSTKREPGMHVRFLLRQWDPRLMLHGVALEQDFMNRLLTLDPQAQAWVNGFSWQFALEDSSACPSLPHPGSWTAPAGVTEPAPVTPTTRPAGIIEGPSVMPRTSEDVRGDLERLLAVRDDDLKRHGPGGDHFAPTRPANL